MYRPIPLKSIGPGRKRPGFAGLGACVDRTPDRFGAASEAGATRAGVTEELSLKRHKKEVF
jgi:hypothetical protein